MLIYFEEFLKMSNNCMVSIMINHEHFVNLRQTGCQSGYNIITFLSLVLYKGVRLGIYVLYLLCCARVSALLCN